MGWESRLARFVEVPGTRDPVLFRYPARSTAAVYFLLGAILLGIAWLAWKTARRDDEVGALFFAALPGLGGIVGVCTGFLQLFVRRHLEIHETRRVLVTVRRTPLGGAAREAYPFDRMVRIVVQEQRGGTEDRATATLVIEMSDGRHVDLGSLYSPAEGRAMAERLGGLTGAPRA